MIKTIKNLIQLPAVPGREDALRGYIAEVTAPFADEVRTDALGSLLVTKRGSSGSPCGVMISACMSGSGYFVTFIEESGLLRVAPAGAGEYASAAYSPVMLGGGVRGMIVPGAESPPADWKPENYYVDIGAKNKQEAEEYARPGDFLARDPYYAELCGGRIAGTAAARRAGCAVLIETLRSLDGCPNDITFVFAAHDAAAGRGAGAAAASIMPEVSITVQPSPAGEGSGAKTRTPVKLGGGAVIMLRGGSLVYNPGIITRMRGAAEGGAIRCQTDPGSYCVSASATATAPAAAQGAGILAGGIGIPVRYARSGIDVIDMDDVRECVKLCIGIINAASGK